MNAKEQHELQQIANEWTQWVRQPASHTQAGQVMYQLLSALVERITTTVHERVQADACRVEELERLVDLLTADAPPALDLDPKEVMPEEAVYV
ncbi:MAG: hypothetical protein M3Y81_18080 [Chloroflexota bacterium]|nr:hypothetical protein [Chloroflexota bacterium]